MQPGDIVKSNAHFRSRNISFMERNPNAAELAIVTSLNDSGSRNVITQNGNERSWSLIYLELVHELHTAEARAIHEAYPRHQGHDYYWYCEQRGVTPSRSPGSTSERYLDYEQLEPDLEPEQIDSMLEQLEQAGFDADRVANEEPLTWEQWLPGDVLERIDGGEFTYTRSSGLGLRIGQQCLVRTGPVTERNVYISNLAGIEMGGVIPAYMRFVRRPVAAVVAAVPAPDLTDYTNSRNWLPGDVLRRRTTVSFGNGGILAAGDEAVFVQTDENGDLEVALLDGTRAATRYRHGSFTWISRPATIPATPRALQVGDRVQLVNIPGVNHDGESWNGQQGILTYLPFRAGDCATITRDSGVTQNHLLRNMELVLATTTPVDDLSTVPSRDWRVGDTVRRIAATGETDYGVIGGEYQVTEQRNGPYITTNAYDSESNWAIPVVDLVLVRRAVVAERVAGALLNTDIGVRVLINTPGNIYHDRVGSVCATRSSNFLVHIDGTDSASSFTEGQVQRLLEERALPAYRAGSYRSVWLDLDGATKEDCDAFISELGRYGISNRQNTGNGFGSQAEGPRNHINGRRVGLFIENRSVYYYWRSSYNPTGSLLRDWNQVLRELKVARGAQWTSGSSTPAAAIKNHGLAKLPHYFILEGGTRNPEAYPGVQTWLSDHGFTGFTGHYSLFAGNTVLGTNLLGAADAFQAKHNCVRLNSTTDRVLISTLFNQRKTMLTTQAAQQRFALDVEASGPHLIVAFTAFMASIGYRQQNVAKTSGPYILLNGGNIHANQPATWQYSDVKNNRNALLNLAEPASNPGSEFANGKSGWEKLGERLANRGVALPVLDGEDLDRTPVVGDKVCLVFNDVRDGYPETDADLRAHTCGQQYTVARLVGNCGQLTETGLLLHIDRLQVLETPRGLQNGDQVQMSGNYGEHLVTDQVMTLMNGTLVAADNTAYAVPVGMYTAITPELLTANLLRRYGITLPCVVKVTNTLSHEHGNEQVISTAWPLNNQELAFWTEDTVEKDSWYERSDFQIITATSTPDLFQPAWRVLKGATRETTVVQIGELQISLAQLEDALA